jgi:ubiquinone biosynthesis protein UbiJ
MTLLLKPAELALNAALGQDPETQDKIKQFEHRNITIKIKDINYIINVLFKNQQLFLNSHEATVADLTITANAINLVTLSQHPDNLFSTDIEIHGDVQFAKQLRDLLEGFDFDWEALLAKYTGDTLAYPIAYGLRQFANWATTTHQSMQQTIAEYFREEARLLPDQIQITDYLSNIDQLRADFDRLEARINRLQGNKE